MGSCNNVLKIIDLLQNDPELIFQVWQENVFLEAKVEVLILRSDLFHPWVQGNKWYKLKGYLTESVATQNRGFVSCGGAFSNHLTALAFAAHELNKNAVFFVRGERKEWENNPAVRLWEDWGAQLFPVSRSEFKKVYGEDGYWKNLVSGHSDFTWVPLGGTSTHCLPYVSQWATQISEGQSFDVVVLPVGSGGTVAGFACGLNQGTQLIGIEALKSNGGLQEEVDDLLQNYSASSRLAIDWQDGYHFGGFAKPSPELWNFCFQHNQKKTFPVEPTYSGKAAYAVLDLAQKGYFREGSRILLVHTGGLFPWNQAVGSVLG